MFKLILLDLEYAPQHFYVPLIAVVACRRSRIASTNPSPVQSPLRSYDLACYGYNFSRPRHGFYLSGHCAQGLTLSRKWSSLSSDKCLA